MANVKVPALLHKMSKAAQKAWYKKNNMTMPSEVEGGGRSAAAAKRVVAPAPRKQMAAAPQSVRAMNTARQQAYYAKGGRQPIGAGGSGGSNSMAGVGQSSAKEIIKGIKAGYNPKVALVRYTNEEAEQVDEVTKKEAEETLGGPVKTKPKMPPGKQPEGYRYVRALARRAMKAGLKKEEVEQVAEIDYKKYLKVSQEKRPFTIRTVDAALKTDKAGDPNPLRKLQNTNAARKFAQKQLTKKFNASQPAKPFPVYEPGRRYVGDSVELDGPTIDEARRMSAAEKLGRAFDSEQQRSALSRQRGLDLLKQKDTEKMQNKPASGDMTKLKKEKIEESTMKYIEEKLTAADPASKWISDFVKSDNPKFAGKSKKERIQQALGAYYAKKRETNEEAEQVDHAKLIANSLAATHPNFRVSSYNGDHGRAHVVHHKSDTRNFKNGEQLMGPNIQLQHNHKTNKVHMEMQGDYDNVPDRDEETHHPDKAHEAAHKMFKPAIDLIHTTDKMKKMKEMGMKEEYEIIDFYAQDWNSLSEEEKAEYIDIPALEEAMSPELRKAVKMHSSAKKGASNYELSKDKGGANKSQFGTSARDSAAAAKVVRKAKKVIKKAAGDETYARVVKNADKGSYRRNVGSLGEEIVNEEPKHSADVGEYDYEGDMAKSQLRSILANAKRMHDMLEDTTNLPEWVQSKITLAEDYVVTAANYMESEMNEAVEGKVAVTPKEKSLAAHHGDKTKITYGDVIKARLKSAAAKKMGK